VKVDELLQEGFSSAIFGKIQQSLNTAWQEYHIALTKLGSSKSHAKLEAYCDKLNADLTELNTKYSKMVRLSKIPDEASRLEALALLDDVVALTRSLHPGSALRDKVNTDMRNKLTRKTK
jgi:hypothetical protein